MAFTRRNEVQTHLKATADTRGLSEMAMAQKRALSQMQAQQAAFARASLGQFQRVDKATRNIMRRTGTGAAASLSQGLNAGGKQLHQAGNNLVSIAQKHAVRMGGVFQQLGFQASLVGTSMTQAFTAPVAAAVALSTVVGVKLAAKLESARTALGALLPRGYDVEALLNRLRKAAIKSPVFDTVQLVDFTRKLVASGIEAKKGELIIASLGKVFQTFGVSGEGASLALRGITQAFSKGKLQAEELTGQIGEQIPALRLLARAAGVSQGEFLKMVREGKITSAVFQDLLIKIGKFPEINRGATASLNTMQGAWDRLKESVFDALALTWLKYTPQIQDSLKQIEKQIPNTFKAFGPLIPRIVGGFASLVKAAIGLLGWYNDLDEGTRKLVNTLGLLLVVGGPLIIFFGKLATGVGAAFVVFKTILTPIGALTVALSALMGIGVVAWLNSVGKEGGLLNGIMDRLSAGWDSAGKKAVGLAGHLRTVTTDFDNLKTRVSGSLRTLNTDFSDTASKAVGLSGTFRSLGRDFSDTASKITGLSGTFRSVERDFGNTEKSAVNLSGSFRGLGRDFGNLGKVSSETQDPVKKFGADLRRLKDSITDNLIPAIGNFGKKLGGELQPALENVNDIIGGKGSGLLETLKKFTDDLSNWVDTNGDKIAEGVGKWAEDLTSGMKKALEDGDWKSLGKAAGEAVGEILSGIGDLTEEMKKAFEKVDWVEVGKETGKHAFGFITGFMAGLGDDISSIDFWKEHWGDAAIAGVSFMGVGKIASALGKVLRKVIPKGFRGAKKAFQKGWEGAVKGFDAIKGSNFVKLLGPMKNILIPFRALWDNIGKKAIEGGRNVISAVRSSFGQIGSVARTTWDNVSSRFNFERIKNAFRTGFSTLRGTVQSGMETIALKFLYAKDRVMNVLHRVLLDPLLGAGRSLKSIFLTFVGRFAFLTWLVEAGKDVIQGFIDGVVEKAKDIWKKFKEKVLDPLINGIKNFFGIKSPSTLMHTFGEDVIQGFINGMLMKWGEARSQISSIWGQVRNDAASSMANVGSSITTALNQAKAAASTSVGAIRNTLSSGWSAVKSSTQSSWTSIANAISSSWSRIRTANSTALSSIRSTVTTSWDTLVGRTRSSWDTIFAVVRSRWNAARDSIKRTWSGQGGIKSILDTFGKHIRDTVPGLVSRGVHSIGLAFNRVMRGAADPINWVITNVINNGIRNAFNTISKWLHLGLSLGKVPNIGVGGASLSQRNRREKGGFADTPLGVFQKPTVIVGEGNTNAPEYVIPTDPKYRPRAMKLYESLGAQLMATGGKVASGAPPRKRKPGLPMMATGGIIPGDGLGFGPDILGPIKSGLQSKLLGPLKGLKNKPDAPIWKVAKGLPKRIVDLAWPIAAKALPKAGFSELLSAAKGMGLSGIVSKLQALLMPVGGFGLGSDSRNAVGAIVAMAKRFYSGARLSSGYRPGDPGYHGRGLAADLIGGGTSGMARIARGFYGISGRLLELIHSGGGGYFVKNGRRVGSGYYRSVLGGHYNHVHVAARRDALAGGGFGGGGSLGAWVSQAMALTRTPGNWFTALVALARHESGGNPRAINLWDSNARAGHPSKGLFQTIDSTFRRYALPGMGNIWNPVHNGAAAMRYIRSRYGSIFRIPSYRPGPRFVGGYEFGTPFVPQTGMALVHKGERIIPATQNRGYEIRGHRRGAEGGIHVHFEGPVMGHRDLEDAITGIVDQLRRKGRLPKR